MEKTLNSSEGSQEDCAENMSSILVASLATVIVSSCDSTIRKGLPPWGSDMEKLLINKENTKGPSHFAKI